MRRVTAGTALRAGRDRAVVGVSVPGVVDPDGATVHYAWNIGQSGPFDLRTPAGEGAASPRSSWTTTSTSPPSVSSGRGRPSTCGRSPSSPSGPASAPGIVHEGQLLRGAHGAAGEVAFLPLSPDYQRRRAASPDEAGRPDPAGEGAGPAAVGRTADHRPASRSSSSAPPGGEAPAVALVEEESRRIAAITASICAIIDPETVILAGGVGANEALVARTSELVDAARPLPAGRGPLRPGRPRQPRRSDGPGRPQDPGEPRRRRGRAQRRRRVRVPAVTDGPAPRIRPATPEDAVELLRLRILLLESLGRDPGPPSAPWRQDALRWFADRTTSPRWRIQVAADGRVTDTCWRTARRPWPSTCPARPGRPGSRPTSPRW